MKDIHNISNPWLGLKTYEEGQILYGRTDDINTLSQNILFNIQTVIYGKSGIGKSSILNAGVFPILRKSNFFPVNIRLVHNQPEKNYNSQIWECVINSLYNLRRERLTSDGTSEILTNLKGRYEELVSQSENESLWEMFHRNVFYDDLDNRIKPVLVFDQFEEIFTRELNQKKVSDFFNELADLINNVVPAYLLVEDTASEKKIENNDLNDNILLDEDYDAAFADYLMESNFHIVITLREDFLSYLERNITNIPLLKHNRYCLKPLNEEQAASVIMDPYPGLVTEDVAKEIISKVTATPTSDFDLGNEPELDVDSAILSLFLSELYNKKQPYDKIIDKSLVIDFGDNIIQDFYERTISNISEDCAEYLEYRLITEDGRRDSVFESHVIYRKGYKSSDLEYLKKQRLIREFPWNDGIRIEFIHDVLCPIIVRRKEERKLAKQKLEEERLIEEERKRVLLESQKKEEKLKRKNRNILIAFTTTFVFSVILLLTYLYCKVWDYREYYEWCEWRYELPYGINKLSKKELKNTACFFEFTKKGKFGKQWKMIRCLNSTMNLSTQGAMGTLLVPMNSGDDGVNSELKSRLEESCIWESITDKKEKMPMQLKVYDRKHELICCFSTVCHYENDTLRYVIGQYIDEDGQPVQSRKNGASIVKITLDDMGFRSFIEYFDSWNNRVRNYDNAYAQIYEYSNHPDSLGLQVRYGSANHLGEYVYDKVGNSGMKVIYVKHNDKWRVKESISVDPDGNICPVKDGYSVVLYEYDDKGRQTKMSYFDAEYDPAGNLSDNNVHSYEYVYDKYGNIAKIYCYGIDGKPNKGVAYREIKIDPTNGKRLEYAQYDRWGNLFDNSHYCIKYDDRNNPDKKTELKSLDENGCVQRDVEGVYITKYEYDNYGNNIRELYYEEDGETLMSCDKGYVGINRVYNDDNKLIELSYVDNEGSLTPTYYGYSKIVYRYDAKGNKLEETYYDANDEKCETHDGICSVVYKYDVLNNLIQENYKDKGGKNAYKYVVSKYKYDYWGNKLEDAKYNADEITRTENTNHIHRICYEYDSLFYEREKRYYDKFNHLTACPDDTTYSIVRYENDEYGNALSVAYYNIYDERCECKDGYHKMMHTFDVLGNVLSEKYYDSENMRVRHPNGCWEGRVDYDKSFVDKFSIISGHDKYGNLMNTNEGWAYTTFKYDNIGNEIERAYYDMDSIPVMNDNIYHKKISIYDGTNEIRTEYYDVEDKLIKENAIIVCQYNIYDRLTYKAYYNGNNDKCVGPEGWHCVKYEYDENNRLLEKSYWNVDDKPVDIILDNKKIACRIKYSYDRGFDKSEWHYMADGDSICISGYISKLLDNGDYFEGYVKNEIPNGYGKYVSVRGWNYEGDWKDNYFDGKGKYTYENGYYYIGDFERDNFHGYGSVYSINDSLCYSGKFKDNEYIGQVLISIEDMEKNSLTELGIQEGDVILEFNDFEYFKNKCKINDISVLLEDFERAVENSYGKEKEIVIASQKEGLYYIKKFTVPSSEHIDVYRTYYAKDVDEIYNTYMNYKNGN